MRAINFPHDEHLHPQAVEWWYWNGRLGDGHGGRYAFMAALFKVKPKGLKPLFFLHSLVSDLQRKTFEPRIKVFYSGLDRGSFPRGEPKASREGYFSMDLRDISRCHLKIPGLDLKFISRKPPLLQGGTGILDFKTSVTNCYSLTRLDATGVTDGDIKVCGTAWMDHQWGDFYLDREHAWNWFSLQLDDGTDICCFEFGRRKKTLLATVSLPDGSVLVSHDVKFRPRAEAWRSPVTGARYPLAWDIEMPEIGIQATVKALVREMEMTFGPINYWEGPLEVTAHVAGRPVRGQGFMELVGMKREKSYPRLVMERTLRRMPLFRAG